MFWLFSQWKLTELVLEWHTNKWIKSWALSTLFCEKTLIRVLTRPRLPTLEAFMLLFTFRVVDMEVESPWRPRLWLCLTSAKCRPSREFIMTHKMIESVAKACQMPWPWPWPKHRQLSDTIHSNDPHSCLSIMIKRTGLFSGWALSTDFHLFSIILWFSDITPR